MLLARPPRHPTSSHAWSSSGELNAPSGRLMHRCVGGVARNALRREQQRATNRPVWPRDPVRLPAASYPDEEPKLLPGDGGPLLRRRLVGRRQVRLVSSHVVELPSSHLVELPARGAGRRIVDEDCRVTECFRCLEPGWNLLSGGWTRDDDRAHRAHVPLLASRCRRTCRADASLLAGWALEARHRLYIHPHASSFRVVPAQPLPGA